MPDVTDLHTDIRWKKSTAHVIDGVDFTVDTGETPGIVGESGRDKTMTVLSVIRLLPVGCHIVSGRILLAGRDLAALPVSEAPTGRPAAWIGATRALIGRSVKQ